MMTYNIKILNKEFGTLVDERFADATQFKLFLKAINGALELKENLKFFNGVDFLINIPYTYLCESIVLTSTTEVSPVDIVKSKIEALVTK